MDNTDRAWEFFERAVERQMAGDFEVAIELYTQSIDTEPTAEAFTYRGWTHSYMGRVDLAIDDCKRAIEVDPEFGNPYNDIGAYLIDLDRPEEAVPWLEKAISAPRYDERQFPWANLARIHEAAGRLTQALRHYRQALEVSPGYLPALIGAKRMLGRLN